MSLARRIIPSILSRRGQLVKGERFAADRVIGHALQAAKIHALRGVDELLILDVAASKENRDPDYKLIKALSERCFSPITYGGGVKSVDHVRELLRSGADKVCIGSGWVENHAIIKELSEKFGRSTIVASLDIDEQWTLELAIHTARWLESQGAGEILLQNKEREGTMAGYDIDLISAISHAVDVPVIASGGCSGFADMLQALEVGASAVSAGALFQYTDATPAGASSYLAEQNIEVRL